MSAHSIHRFGFVARSVAPEPDDAGERPAGPAAVGELLRAWRSAERRLAEVEPGSDAWARLQAEIEHLRQRYQEAFSSLSNSDPTGSST